MTKFDFPYVTGRTEVEISSEHVDSDFFNLKNKAEGARRYGYRKIIRKIVNPDGAVAFRPIYQTTLNGSDYQSGKYGDYVATEADAVKALDKTAAAAMKRYAKLAQDPAASKIEYRTALGNATTAKIGEAADALKK